MRFLKVFLMIKKFINSRKNKKYDIKDIVWAKRYKTKDEEKNIPKGHRNGPYIIISKKGKKLYAVSCSSKNNNAFMKYKINSDKYNFDRDSYAYLGKIEKIDKRRIIKKIDVIGDSDYDRLYKTLYVMKNKYNIINEMGEFNTIFYCDVGDILHYYHQIFYIYDKDNMYLYGYVVHKKKDLKNTVYINSDKYSIDIQAKRKIPINDKYRIIDIARDNDFKNIDKYFIKQMKIIQEKRILNRGKLIKYKKQYYYIYGQYIDQLLLYKIYLATDDVVGKKKIIINGGVYYTLFEEEKISKYAKAKIIRGATKEEMRDISKAKKEYIASIKEKNSKIVIKCKNYKEGKIILDINTLERYVIVRRMENKIVYVSLENNKYYMHDFSKSLDFNYSIVEDMDKYKFYNISKLYRLNYK